MDAVVQLNSALQGRYDVEREIGAGGMATVYLARDIKHDRRVALKVLKPELGAVLGVERFLAEIKVTANLQHPNLLPLFDSGEAGGQLFYVMPFVEGESLRARLDREKQLPVDEAIRIATAVASALDYAHRQNVIHRDLKPENILLHEGQPVVADFGIALAVSNAGGGRITQTGLSLGTPAYMSPEQATGDRAIDGRTDIYSLGAMTHEMLVGDPPHIASTSQAIIAKVLTERPASVRVSRSNVSEHVAAAIEHALEKLPADRFATAHEFADALTGKAIVSTSSTAATAAVAAGGGAKMRTALVRAGVGAVWIATIAAAILLRPAPDQREIRFSIPTPDTPRPQMIAVSPDGRLVAYVGLSADGKSPVLWIRPLAATIAQPIAGTDGANFPFWSPDSRFVGFGVTGKLKKVDVTGGPPQNVADISGFAGGTWNRDDIIVFSDGTKLKRVAAVGGTASDLTVSDNNAARRIYPAFLPDGRHFLYSTFDGDAGKRGIYAGSLAGGTSSLVVQAESKPVYAGAGLLLFQREGTVFAQPFDAGNLRLTGEPRRVADDVAFNSLSGFGAFAASDNGVLVFRGGVAAMLMNELRWLGRDGKLLGKAGEPGAYRQIALSPDDKRVAIERRDSKTTKYDVWTLELSSDIQTRLTFDSASALGPIWAPDSRTVVFHSTRKGPINFYQKTIGSSNEAVVLESAESPKYTEDVSGDGKFFLYHRDAPVGLYALPRTGDRKPITLVESQFSIDEARFSPDGKWIAYGSTESGEWEVYVAAFPAFDHRQRVSSHGGGQVRWRADGKELYYLSPDGKVMAVAARAGSPLEFIVPKELFQSPIARPSMNIDQWGVSRDGQRFLFIAPMQTQAATIDPITVVVNWQRGLKK